MLCKHTFQIHALCPLVQHTQWDYYDVCVETNTIVDVHYLETVMNAVRGKKLTQEEIAIEIKKQLPIDCQVKIFGMHSQSSKSVVFA